MIKFKTTFILCVMLFAFTKTIQAQQPVDHMSQLSTAFTDLKQDTWKYLRTITKGKSARASERKRESLIEEYKTQIAVVKSISPYNGDATLKDATLKYLNLSYTVLREDYDKIVDMEAVAEESYDAMEAYILANKRANEKLTAAGDELEEAEKDFAEKNNITLIEGEQDKKSEKISKAADMLDYYNEVYLIFFKVFKQEAYVLAAQQANDITSFEQNVNALKMEAEMALKKLDTLRKYNGSSALIISAKRVMNFYKDEAENEFPKVSDFYIKKDNFEKSKEIMESKKKRDLTQEDVDNYNNAVEEYNQAAGSMNETNEEMNKSRSEMLDKWNESVEDFFKAHS